MMAWKSSWPARAAPISLMTASSALRCSVSASRRFGLVEEPRVLEAPAHGSRPACEQALVGLAEAVLLEPFERDDAKDAVAGKDRHPEPRLLGVR